MSKYLGIAYNLRLPPELKERIAASAKSLNRSMNADIVARLEQSFADQSVDSTPVQTTIAIMLQKFALGLKDEKVPWETVQKIFINIAEEASNKKPTE